MTILVELQSKLTPVVTQPFNIMSKFFAFAGHTSSLT